MKSKYQNLYITTMVFLLPVFSTVHCFAQNNAELISEIDLQIQKARSFIRMDFDSAAFYAKKAMTLSDEIAYDDGKINAISMLADAHFYLMSLDSALTMSNLLLEMSEINEAMAEVRFQAWYRICKIYHYKGDYPLVIEIADRAIHEMGAQLDNKNLAGMYNLTGLTYKQMGKFDKAQEQFIEAINYAEKAENNYLLSILHTNLGIVNRNLEQYPKALDYYDRALKNLEVIQDTIGMGLLYQNFAAVYSDLNDNRKSLAYNFMAKEIIGKNHANSIDYATLINNIGLNYYGLQKPDSAIRFLNEALAISTNLEDAFGMADTKINLGRVLLKNNQVVKARSSIEKGIEMATDIEADDIAIEGYEMLIECEIAVNDYKSAFATQKILNALQDSVYNIEKVNAINEMQEKYETEKKEQENILLKAENELKDIRLYWLIGVAALIVAVTLIILYVFQKTRRAKRKIEMLQREIHHRVKNNLAIIRRLADVSRQSLDDPAAQTALAEFSSRIDSMVQVHAQLYQKTDITEVNFKNYLIELADNIHASFSGEHVELSKMIETNANLEFSKAVPLGLIINELLTNAFKYATNPDGIKILLSAKTKGNMLEIMVSDNGPGLPPDFDLETITSYGLKMVAGLVQQLDGRIQFSKNNGAKVKIEIPV
jgi:two-component system, sensor histidine kinase PdtaS